MDDRKRTLAAIAIVIGFFLLLILLVGAFFSRKSVVSPVPEEGAIKIIFVTPIAVPQATAGPSATPTIEVKKLTPTTKPKPKATPTP